MEKMDCSKCGGSGYLPRYSYWMEGVCFQCDGTGKEYRASWFTNPALVFHLKPSFRKATKGRQSLGVSGKGEDGTIFILSEPVPPEIARHVFDTLTGSNRDRPNAGRITNEPDGSQLYIHACQNATWRIHLFTSQPDEAEPFSQIQLVFSPEWEATARALVKIYIDLFVIIDNKQGAIKRDNRKKHEDDDVQESFGEDEDSAFRLSHDYDDNDVETIDDNDVETIDDLAPEGLGVGDVSFQDADSEYP